ncbi:MAG: CPBP family glutamic-type intramembrane protease [Phycisphaerales bacterium]|nr:CPBP family glutamic-type intramembrane protease [Phycisphaerales bacterium]
MSQRSNKQPAILPTQIRSGARPAYGGYFWLSSHPLHILVFLLPVIAFYEIGSVGLFGDGGIAKLEAQDLLVRFFDLFGVLGLHLPAFALIVTLIAQHVLSKEPWKIVPIVPFAMIAESAFLTGPLIVMVIILNPQSSVMMQLTTQVNPVSTPESHTFLEGLYLSFGAGLYEEMLFRLVFITILHFLVTDVLGFKDKVGKTFAIIISAIAFAWLHDGVYLRGSGLNFRLASFYVLAGVYFGILFLSRGLGIAVGAHLMYDILVFVVMPGIQDQS